MNIKVCKLYSNLKLHLKTYKKTILLFVTHYFLFLKVYVTNILNKHAFLSIIMCICKACLFNDIQAILIQEMLWLRRHMSVNSLLLSTRKPKLNLMKFCKHVNLWPFFLDLLYRKADVCEKTNTLQKSLWLKLKNPTIFQHPHAAYKKPRETMTKLTLNKVNGLNE